MGAPWEDIKTLFTKQGQIDNFQPYLINRWLSFNNSTFGLAVKMDKYTFWLDNKLQYLMFNALIPKGKSPFIRYQKGAEEPYTEFQPFIDDLQKHYNWTDEDVKAIKPFLIEQFDNKIFLEKVMRFVGADKKHFKTYGFTLNKPVSKEGVMKWL